MRRTPHRRGAQTVIRLVRQNAAASSRIDRVSRNPQSLGSETARDLDSSFSSSLAIAGWELRDQRGMDAGPRRHIGSENARTASAKRTGDQRPPIRTIRRSHLASTSRRLAARGGSRALSRSSEWSSRVTHSLAPRAVSHLALIGDRRQWSRRSRKESASHSNSGVTERRSVPEERCHPEPMRIAHARERRHRQPAIAGIGPRERPGSRG